MLLKKLPIGVIIKAFMLFSHHFLLFGCESIVIVPEITPKLYFRPHFKLKNKKWV